MIIAFIGNTSARKTTLADEIRTLASQSERMFGSNEICKDCGSTVIGSSTQALCEPDETAKKVAKEFFEK